MRLRQVALAARALEPARLALQRVLGLGEAFRDPGVAEFGLQNVVLPIGDAFLEVVSPVQPGTTAGRWLDRRGGDAGYMAIFQTGDLAAARERMGRLGVRVVWEATLDDAATLHLHPRDVGGAIVSIDAMQPPESWRWAGPGWRERSQADVATGLVGAVLEAPDPEKLALRWGEVLAVRPDPDAEGGYTLALERGTRVRVVPARGGGEAALVAIEVAVRDRARFAAEAAAAGVLDPDGAARIAGTRIVPV
jgi:Glyoxalase-like domain